MGMCYVRDSSAKQKHDSKLMPMFLCVSCMLIPAVNNKLAIWQSAQKVLKLKMFTVPHEPKSVNAGLRLNCVLLFFFFFLIIQ